MRQLSFYVFLTLTVLFSKEVFSQQQETRAIEVRTSSPMFGESFYRVYYSGDLVLYQSQYRFDSSEVRMKIDTSGKVAVPSENTMILSEWRNKFFVFHKDSSYGYSYNPHSTIENGKRLNVDSSLKLIRGSNRYDSVISIKPDSSSWLQNHTLLREVYRCPGTDSTPSGRIILTYSKNLVRIKESLNQAVDDMKEMKLFRIQLAYNKFYDKRTRHEWPAMEMLGKEMTEITIKNADEITSYFDQYKRNISSH